MPLRHRPRHGTAPICLIFNQIFMTIFLTFDKLLVGRSNIMNCFSFWNDTTVKINVKMGRTRSVDERRRVDGIMRHIFQRSWNVAGKIQFLSFVPFATNGRFQRLQGLLQTQTFGHFTRSRLQQHQRHQPILIDCCRSSATKTRCNQELPKHGAPYSTSSRIDCNWHSLIMLQISNTATTP